MSGNDLDSIGHFSLPSSGGLFARSAVFTIPLSSLAVFLVLGEVGLLIWLIGLPLGYFIIQSGTGRYGQFWRGKFPKRVANLVQREQLEMELDGAMQSYVSGALNAACFAVEIDGFDVFKRKNGVQAGHEVFQISANRLANAVRRSNTIARISDSGFGLSIRTIRRYDIDAALRVAERMKAALELPVVCDGVSYEISCSIGFCVASQAPTTTGKGLLDGAARAATDAFEQGFGNLRAYTKAMGGVYVRPELTEDVDRGFENGEILPFFQPQVCAKTQTVTGLEALARWKHPEHGLIPPLEFLNAVSLANRWVDLTDTMIDGALATLKALDEKGIFIPQVGVNFAQADLEDPALVDRVRWALDRHDLTANRLTIEVLESVIASNEECIAKKTVDALANIGCSIDLDDFGTGHASISSLRQFNINRIKVDRSFVTNLDHDPDQHQMMSTILVMAKQLRMETLAEGVETPAELEALKKLGCQHVQGYGIAKPMPAADLQDWLENHTAKAPMQHPKPKSA